MLSETLMDKFLGYLNKTFNILGPLVQSIVSLICLLMTNPFTVLAKVFLSTLIFLLQKYAKATNIFAAKNISVFAIFQDRNFNVTLANNFINV